MDICISFMCVQCGSRFDLQTHADSTLDLATLKFDFDLGVNA